MSSLLMITIFLPCVASLIAVAFHYALDASACLKVIRKRQSFVRETEIDEWLLVVSTSAGVPILLFAGLFHLTSSLTSAAWQLGVGLIMLGYVVVAGRRRWHAAPRLCLYGHAGEIVRDHVRRGMALEIAAWQADRPEPGRKGDETRAEFPGLEFADAGLGITLVRGLADWRGQDALRGVLLKRVLQTNMLCDQQLNLDVRGIWISLVASTVSSLASLIASVWIVSLGVRLP